jgi:inorganic pyrophosphatase
MEVKVLIEITAGSNVKYEVDEATGKLNVDRFLHTAMVYPFNYGSIEATRGKDGDPLDAMVLTSDPILAGSVIKVHPIGLLEMEDEGGIDTKILTVPDQKVDPVYGIVTDISQIPDPTKAKIKHFFDHMKELEPGKWVKTGAYQGPAAAEDLIAKSHV